MSALLLILYDAEETYAKSLAAGLKYYLQGQAGIRLVKNREELISSSDFTEDTVLLSGDLSLFELKKLNSDLKFCYLASEEYETVSDNEVRWDYYLYKYQSVQAIARAVISRFGPQNRVYQRKSDEMEEWYGIVSAAHHEMMIPYSLAMASILAEQKKVMWVGLAEFCGISGLLGLEHMYDTGDLFGRLRAGFATEDEQRQSVIWVENLGILEPPENPMILYELQENDLLSLTRYIRGYRQVDAVVWLVGNLFPGSVWLLNQCRRIFSLEKGDVCSRCLNQEFRTFLERLNQQEVVSYETVTAPSLLSMEPGLHLLQQWANSSMGGEIRKRFGKEYEY